MNKCSYALLCLTLNAYVDGYKLYSDLFKRYGVVWDKLQVAVFGYIIEWILPILHSNKLNRNWTLLSAVQNSAGDVVYLTLPPVAGYPLEALVYHHRLAPHPVLVLRHCLVVIYVLTWKMSSSTFEGICQATYRIEGACDEGTGPRLDCNRT